MDERLPYEPDSERYILSVLLSNPEQKYQIMSALKKEYFSGVHEKIFLAIMKILDQNVDVLTTMDAVKELGFDNDVTPTYLVDVAGINGSVYNWEYHARLLHEAWQRRKIIAMQHHLNMAYNKAVKPEEILGNLDQEILAVQLDLETEPKEGLERVVREAVNTIEARAKQERPPGLLTGIDPLDEFIGGFEKGDYIIIAARPSVGKSLLVKEMARRIGREKRIGIINLEGSAQDFVNRMIAAETGIEVMRVRKGALTDDELEIIAKKAAYIASLNIFVMDKGGGLGINELYLHAKRMIKQYKLDILAVDYLQLIRAPNMNNTTESISYISNVLKGLATETDVPVIAVSQLNRSTAISGDRPKLHHLRGSGQLEQDGDIIFLLHRPDEDVESEVEEGILEIDVAKYRNGRTGMVQVNVNWRTTSIKDESAVIF